MSSAHEQYIQTLVKVAIAQICEQVGFSGIKSSALRTLVNVVERYIKALCHSAHENANLACRSHSNFFDFQDALKDLCVDLDSFIEFFNASDELEFVKDDLPEAPIRKAVLKYEAEDSIQEALDKFNKRKRKQTEEAGEEEGDQMNPQNSQNMSNGTNNHVPADSVPQSAPQREDQKPPPYVEPFLPKFPSLRTYKNTKMIFDKKHDLKDVRDKQMYQNQQLEQSLAILHKNVGLGSTASRNYKVGLSQRSMLQQNAPLWGSISTKKRKHNPFLTVLQSNQVTSTQVAEPHSSSSSSSRTEKKHKSQDHADT